MIDEKTENLLKILVLYKMKKVPRNSSNNYFDEKDNIFYHRREVDAEHVYSCFRLADFMLTNEDEFSRLDKLRVYELLMYHDDCEIKTRDTGIDETDKREYKEKDERDAVKALHKEYPKGLDDKLLMLDLEFREGKSPEAKFAKAIDKLDAIVHEIQYPEDWLPKGFDEHKTRRLFQPTLEYSPTFMYYFEGIIKYLKQEGHFK